MPNKREWYGEFIETLTVERVPFNVAYRANCISVEIEMCHHHKVAMIEDIEHLQIDEAVSNGKRVMEIVFFQ